MKYCRGVTLVELMIAIVVMGILTAMAVPNYQEWMKSQQVRNITENIQNGIRTAQMEAVRRNQPVTFWMVSSLDNNCALAVGPTWIVGNQSANGNLDAGTTDPSGQCDNTFLQRAAGTGGTTGITITSTGNANCVAFNGFGQVAQTDPTCTNPISRVTATVTSTGKARAITINNGNILLCDPALPSSDPRGCK
ncbi:MAG: GspH/FimT family pseudopilin [Formivibrio sp.]|nr:GspH/FimT family pseudopilin [Formivibrio sp.]